MHDEKTLKWFEKMGKTPPTHEPHGDPEAVVKGMKKQLPTEWKLKGNMLTGKTSMGQIGHTIPPNYILKGTDEKGMPILEKIKM